MEGWSPTRSARGCPVCRHNKGRSANAMSKQRIPLRLHNDDPWVFFFFFPAFACTSASLSAMLNCVWCLVNLASWQSGTSKRTKSAIPRSSSPHFNHVLGSDQDQVSGTPRPALWTPNAKSLYFPHMPSRSSEIQKSIRPKQSHQTNRPPNK